MVAQGGAGPGDWQNKCLPIFVVEHHFPSEFAFPALLFTSGGPVCFAVSSADAGRSEPLWLANCWLELSAADTCLSGVLHDT